MAGNNGFSPSLLKAGDILLYKPVGFFGWVIRIKTWHKISHVEVYLGNGVSSASRDGLGVNIYPLRVSELAVVMRPKQPFDVEKAIALTKKWMGTPYGWIDLLNFAGISINTKGIVCSPWATMLLRDNGIPVFNDDPINLIAPFQFADSELLTLIWREEYL